MTPTNFDFGPRFEFSIRASPLTAIASFAALFCAVFLIEESMRYVGFFDSQAQAIWWPTNGLALALMVRSSRRHWFFILSTVVCASSVGVVRLGLPWSCVIVNGVANSVGPLIGALALPRFKTLEDWLQERHLVSRFVGFALVLAPLVSATIYATNAHWFLPHVDVLRALRARADSDMLGYSLFTPLVLILGSERTYVQLRHAQPVVPIVLLGVVAASTYLVFWQTSYSICFALVLVVLLVCLRLGFAASVVAVNLLAAMATTATMHGLGPLALGAGIDLSHRVLLLQFFLAITMVTVFSISVVQIERDVFHNRLNMAYNEMEKLATTDSMTGLANRRLFEKTMDIEWARAKRKGESIALLMMDVDHFKSYNDEFGHPAGDACLRSIAQAILSIGHRPTDLLARYGGEEFIFLLPDASAHDAARIAERLRKHVEKLHLQEEERTEREVSISIGCVAGVPCPGLFPTLLIAAADEALYRAKRNGRNRVEIAETPTPIFNFEPMMQTSKLGLTFDQK